MSLLTLVGISPLIGALIVLLIPAKKSELIKRAAFIITLLISLFSILLAVRFDKAIAGFQFIQSNSWISAFNVNFAVGVDGISLVLILLSTILVPVVILATWHEADTGRWNTKVFYVLILVLETLMIGVFA
ncbi:MAG: NADH-quinone oxidoreductase subunit M, partial [Actinobacteria bacterium]|nr:NADH-quinone oxidoreductase subunit M [Actinomycetota bacterium]